jgi:hypothetical protein
VLEELTIIGTDFTSVNACRIIVNIALLPLVGKDTNEKLARTISPILKIEGSVFMILQVTVSFFFILMGIYLHSIPLVVFFFLQIVNFVVVSMDKMLFS